jgi:hypothetical protein
MSDKVTLQEHSPSATSSDYGAKSLPRILEIRDGTQVLLENPGFSTSNSLTIEGSATRSVRVELLDNGIPVYGPVDPDETGYFHFWLRDLRSGDHEFIVKDSSGYSSAPWVVKLNVTDPVSIVWVTGPDNLLIDNGGSTQFSKLSFIGDGEADQQVELLDNGEVVERFDVPENKRWFGTVKDLPTGSHEFMARGQKGQESAVWSILIKKETLLSIRFVLGQENFQLIENHGATTDRAVTIVGTANPNEHGWIESANEALPFTANDQGVYIATFDNLAAGLHSFILRSYLGRVSAPWVIMVIASKLQ